MYFSFFAWGLQKPSVARIDTGERSRTTQRYATITVRRGHPRAGRGRGSAGGTAAGHRLTTSTSMTPPPRIRCRPSALAHRCRPPGPAARPTTPRRPGQEPRAEFLAKLLGNRRLPTSGYRDDFLNSTLLVLFIATPFRLQRNRRGIEWLMNHFRIPNSILRGRASNGVEPPSMIECRMPIYGRPAMRHQITSWSTRRRSVWMTNVTSCTLPSIRNERVPASPALLDGNDAAHGDFSREVQWIVPSPTRRFWPIMAHYLELTLSQFECQFQMCRNGNRSTAERVFRGMKRRTSPISNTFSSVQSSTAE